MCLERILPSNEPYMHCYIKLKEWAESLWPARGHVPAIHPYQIDHGPAHSARVHEWMDEILKPKILNEPGFISYQEAFIALSAAYLHDIGMQYGYNLYQFPADGVGFERFQIENPIGALTDEERKLIRKHHAEISGEVIRQFRNELPSALPCECKPILQGLCDILAFVCENHNREDFIEYWRLVENDEPYKKFKSSIKIPFLAALLQAADALHMDKSRIYEPTLGNILDELENDERVYDPSDEDLNRYFLCYYIDEVDLKPISGDVRLLKVYIRRPDSMEDSMMKNFVSKYHKRLARRPNDCLSVLAWEGIFIFPDPDLVIRIEFGLRDASKIVNRSLMGPSFLLPSRLIGRDCEINELYKKFKSDCRMLLIYGDAGTGKTALALNLYRSDKVKNAIWIDCQNTLSLDDLIMQLEEHLDTASKETLRRTIAINLPEEAKKEKILQTVKSMLEGRVVFLDACERAFNTDVMELLQCLDKLDNGKVVMTARSKPCKSFTRIEEIKVNGFSDEKHSIQLLKELGLEDDLSILRQAHCKLQGRPKYLELFSTAAKRKGSGQILDALDQVVKFLLLDAAYNSLEEKHRKLLKCTSIFRKPVSVQDLYAVYREEKMGEAIDYLDREKLLIINSDGSVSIHEMIKEYLYARIENTTEAEELHTIAAEYLESKNEELTQNNRVDYLEAYWHACQAKSYKLAYRIIFTADRSDRLRRWGYSHKLAEIYQELVAIDAGTPRLSEKKMQCNVLRSFGKVKSDLGNYAEAIRYLKQSLNIGKAIGEYDIQSEALGNLASIYSNLGYLTDSIKSYSDAVEIVETHPELASVRKGRRRKALWLGYLGLEYAYSGKIQKAKENCEAGRRISKEIDDDESLGRNLCSLGFAYFQNDELDKAIQLYKEALDASKRIGEKRGEERALGYLGRAYLAKGQLNDAKKVLSEAIEISHNIFDYRREGIWKGYLGGVYFKMSEFDSAMQNLKESLEMANTVRNQLYLPEQLNYLGMVCRKKGQIKEALACFLAAKNIWETSGLHGIKEKIQSNIDCLMRAMGAKEFCTLKSEVSSNEGEIVRQIVPRLSEDWYEPTQVPQD